MSRLTTLATSGLRKPRKSLAANWARASATDSVCSGGEAARRFSSVWIWGSTGMSGDLEQAGRTHAAADAHGDHDELRSAALALDQCVPGHPGARHAIRMADRDRAAVDVQLVRID